MATGHNHRPVATAIWRSHRPMAKATWHSHRQCCRHDDVSVAVAYRGFFMHMRDSAQATGVFWCKWTLTNNFRLSPISSGNCSDHNIRGGVCSKWFLPFNTNRSVSHVCSRSYICASNHWVSLRWLSVCSVTGCNSASWHRTWDSYCPSARTCCLKLPRITRCNLDVTQRAAAYWSWRMARCCWVSRRPAVSWFKAKWWKISMYYPTASFALSFLCIFCFVVLLLFGGWGVGVIFLGGDGCNVCIV